MATCINITLQVLCGVEPLAVVIDFITAFHEKFRAGVFWINCGRKEFIDTSIESIEVVRIVFEFSSFVYSSYSCTLGIYEGTCISVTTGPCAQSVLV